MTIPELDERLEAELSGEFTIERPLGQGRQARVYLAREKALQRRVAIKVLLPDLAGDEVARRRFEREGRSAARIRHPNVTAVYRVGALSDGIPFMVMEYVEGRTLADELAASGTLDPEGARDVLRQLAAALAAAHEEGVLHRDVRPSNILRERNGTRVVLTDFGMAGVVTRTGPSVTRLTRAGELLGDPGHMSPEQLRGDPAVEASDVYALAILGYELLTGDGPFPGFKGTRLLAQHVQGSPVPLTSLRPGVDAALSNLLLRCLEKVPERCPTATELRDRLSGEMDAAEAPPAGALAGFLAELKRRRVYKVAAAYLGLVLVILEASSNVWEPLHLPDWAFGALVWVALGGFPVALVLAWVYDVTSSGIRRTGRAQGEDAGGIHRVRLRTLQAGAVVVSVAVAALLGWWFLER